MESLVVKIIGSNMPPMHAERYFDEEANVEFIEIKASDISNLVFRNLEPGSSLELHSNDKSLGFFTLFTTRDDLILLAKGELENLLKR